MREYLVALLALDGHVGQLAKTAGREGQAGPRRPAAGRPPSGAAHLHLPHPGFSEAAGDRFASREPAP